ncbi:MAG TPA: gas vesicle protein K [Streptosporangiaceae bacterium]|nr:gas vesicle protein K [Streptosporangiaceae bacterium]
MNTDRDTSGATGAPKLPGVGRNLAIDPESAERSLVALVLTVVELLRQLMERQAIRRVDQGDLTADQVEKVGATLMALDTRMNELCEHFGLALDDLNLDLGPLGPLLSRD